MTDEPGARREALREADVVDALPVNDGQRPADEVVPGDPDVRAEQLEYEIDQTREDLTETVQAISQKLDPGNIAREATDSVRQAALGKVDLMAYGVQETWREVRSGNATGIIETVRSNPVPAGMVALGLGMLFMGRGQRAEASRDRSWGLADDRYRDGADDRGSQGRSPIEGIGSTVGSAVDQVTDTVGRVAEEAGQRVSGIASTAGDTATAMPRQAGQVLDEGTSQLRRFMDQSPLVAGLAAMAAGAVIGLVMPSTQMERRTLGPARDDLVDKAERTANELVDKAEQAAGQWSSDSQAQGQAGTPSGRTMQAHPVSQAPDGGVASRTVGPTETYGE